MLSILRHIISTALVLASLLTCGCTKEVVDGNTSQQEVTIHIASRSTAPRATLASVRYILLRDNNIISNETTTLTQSYPLAVKIGTYRLVVVANETPEMTLALNAARTYADLKAVTVLPGQREQSLPLSADVQATVTADASGKGLMSLNSATPTSTPEIALIRTQAKATLFVRKYTAASGAAGDTFTLKRVTLRHVPKHSSMIGQEAYTGSEFDNQVLFDDQTGIAFSSDVTSAEYTEGKTDVTKGNYTPVVAGIPSADQPSNIFPEYRMQNSAEEASAAQLVVMVSYTSGGATTDVTYQLPLRSDELVENYNLLRNIDHQVYLTITRKGNFDAFQIVYQVKDWEGRSLDVEIDKEPYLDVTNIEIDTYDTAATRVYFFTNQPEEKVYIAPTGHLGTASGTAFDVNSLYYELAATVNSTKDVTLQSQNFHYTFDPVTQTGKGYFDVIQLDTRTAGSQVRVLSLRAGKLDRTITVNSIVTEEASKGNTTPYIGTFHRADQRSERIVTWDAVGDWTATIEPQAGTMETSPANLRIDRLASPAYAKGLYKLQNPMQAEGAEVSDGTNGTQTLTGVGRIYFRVGWDSTIGAKEHRYATIKVTYNNNQDTKTIYCRQGEEPDRLSDQFFIEMAAYNVAMPHTFTTYPTMTGYFYQWNDLTPWSPVGTVSNYNTTKYWADFDDERSVCPERYGHPTEAIIGELNTIFQVVQPLWGYYADGYFDRRAVSENRVNGSSTDIAYAGSLFYNPLNGKSVFMPTSGGRLETGEYAPSASSAELESGFWANYSDPNDKSKAIMVTQFSNESPSTASPENKLWAVNVRCLRLPGFTIWFDPNGGSGAPRAITKPQGTQIILPAGPTTGPWDAAICTSWNTSRDGKGRLTYLPGEQISVPGNDITLYAQWETDPSINMGAIPGFNGSLGTTADSYLGNTTVADGNNGSYYTTSATVLAEKVYPFLEVSDQQATATWDAARGVCAAMAPAGKWRLPRAAELHWLYRHNSTLFPAAGFPDLFWSGAEYDKDYAWFLSSGTSFGSPGVVTYTNRQWSKNVVTIYRCVREVVK